jgi:hypothetical protein
MKKQTKKLTLAKETVQTLEAGSLEAVAGGASFRPSCQFICLSNQTFC